MRMITIVQTALTEVPVEPGPDEARDWLLGELSKPPYQAARPTWFDIVARAIGDWFASLRVPDGSGLSALVPLVVVLVVAALIVVAFLVFGRPRLNRRSRVAPGALFGQDDTRSAAELRASAARAAAAGDYRVAIEEAYRGLARGLGERTVVTTAPGTTAADFARRAARAFPGLQQEFAAGAALFDGVRYLERPGTREGYEGISALDRRAQGERPVQLEAIDDVVLR